MVRKGPVKELLLVYLIAFLLLLAIIWYASLTTGLELQFTLNCNSLISFLEPIFITYPWSILLIIILGAVVGVLSLIKTE